MAASLPHTSHHVTRQHTTTHASHHASHHATTHPHPTHHVSSPLTSSAHPKQRPKVMSFPRRASMGSWQRSVPSGVSRSPPIPSSSPAATKDEDEDEDEGKALTPSLLPSSPTAVNAPIAANSCTATATASAEGGSGSCAHTSAAGPGSFRALTRKTSCSRATRCTSGCTFKFKGGLQLLVNGDALYFGLQEHTKSVSRKLHTELHTEH